MGLVAEVSEQAPLSADPRAGLTAAPSSGYVPRDVLTEGRRSAQVTSDAPPSALSQWFETELRPQLERAAHPQTASDLATLLMAGTDATRSLGYTIVGKALAALKTPAGKALAATGRGVESVASALEKPGQVIGAAQALHGNLEEAALTAGVPTAAKFAGQLLQKAGAALAGEGPRLTAVEEAALLKDGYTPATITKIRQAAQRSASAPAAAPAAGSADSTPLAARTPAALATPPPPAKPFLSAAEGTEYLRLLKAKKTPQEAIELIEAQRAFQRRMQLPTSDQTRQSVSDRNVTGRWRGDE